jgi:hypothetical protein
MVRPMYATSYPKRGMKVQKNAACGQALRNMSLVNVRLPGLQPRVECIPALIAYIAMDNASSRYSLALAIGSLVALAEFGKSSSLFANMIAADFKMDNIIMFAMVSNSPN